MTVQELINELNKVENKELEYYYHISSGEEVYGDDGEEFKELIFKLIDDSNLAAYSADSDHARRTLYWKNIYK
jgi:hypothetical protein